MRVMAKKNREKFIKFIHNLFSGGYENKLDIESLQKIILLNILFCIGLPMLIYFSVFALKEMNLWLASMEFLGLILVILCFIHIRKSGTYFLAGSVIAGFMTAFFIFLFITGGIDNSGHLWSLSIPIFLLFVFGTRKGSLAILIFLLLLFFLFLNPVQDIPQQKHSLSFLIRFFSAFFIITAMAFFFETVRTRTNRTLEEKNKELKDTIVELKSTEKVLRESEKRFRELVELLPQPVFEADLSGKVTYLSRSGFELSGYSRDEFDEHFDAFQMFAPEDRRRLKENTRKVFRREKLGGVEYRILKKEGTFLSVIIHSAPIIRENKIIGSRGVIIDISKQKQAEEEKKILEDKLNHSEKMKAVGQLAGGVAHDLNNVLSAIVSYPDLLLMNIPAESPLRRPILTMKKSGQKAAAIVQDLLTLARRGVQSEEVLNLNQVIKEYQKSPEYEKLLSFHNNIRMTTDLQPSLNNILGSKIHLSKMVMNLVSNAAESMPGGGQIGITTFNRYVDKPIRSYEGLITEGEYIVFKISDQGTGIPSDTIKKIFEPFYTKKAMGRSGTGLGMAVVWGTVMDHHGNLVIKSARNQGTTFEIYFPMIRDKIVNRKIKLSMKELMGRGEKILVVDDVEDQREIASSLLRELKYSVKAVSGGDEAIKYLTNNRIDLVILDMIMPPGMDGLETYKKMLKIKPGIKTIITSGYSESERVREAQKLGAGPYIKKPYTIENIGLALKDTLQNKVGKNEISPPVSQQSELT
jgi:two-component system cell cycle sensor histidine kinase/response regulator CckA